MKLKKTVVFWSLSLATLVATYSPAVAQGSDASNSTPLKAPVGALEKDLTARAIRAINMNQLNDAVELLDQAKAANRATQWKSQLEAGATSERAMQLDKHLAGVHAKMAQPTLQFDALKEAAFYAMSSNLPTEQLELSKQALSVAEQIKDQQRICDALDDIYDACNKLHLRKEATATLERVIPMRRQTFDAKKFAAAHSGANAENNAYSGPAESYLMEMRDLAAEYAAAHQWNRGTPIWEELERIHEKALGPDHELTLDIKYFHALNLYHNKDYETARKMCDQLVAAHRRLRPNDVLFLQVLGLSVEIYLDLERYNDAEKAAMEELALAEKTRGASSRYVAGVLENLVQIAALEGKSAQAKSFRTRAEQIRLLTHSKPKRKLDATLLTTGN